jgi:hypothetical protein
MLLPLKRERRGQIIVLFVFVLILLCAICVFTVDVGYLFLCKAELQNAVDAASLAGASQLTGVVGLDQKEEARAEATALADANTVGGVPLHLGENDIEFGHYNDSTGDFIPESQTNVVDSIRVTGRRTPGSPDGPINTFFGSIFGWDRVAIDNVVGVGTKPRRHVMFVLDRSGSMCFDTDDVQLKTYFQDPSDPHMDTSPSGWYWFPDLALKRTGYGWRGRTAWFYARDNQTGKIRTDFLPDHIRNHLEANRYFNFRRREDPATVRSGWIKVPAGVTIYGRWGSPWHNWLADPYFHVIHSQCGYAIAHSPVQPLQSTMDAACAFVDLLRIQDDRAGLVTYASGATLNSRLTSDFGRLKVKLQSFVPAGATAEPEAMELGLDELIDSGRAEGFGQKIMILMTDGNANQYRGNYYGDGETYYYEFIGKSVSTGIHPYVGEAMEQQALRADQNGVRIYSVSFGEDADREVHQQISRVTDGAYYHSENHEDLTEIFVDIFQRLPPVITY